MKNTVLVMYLETQQTWRNATFWYSNFQYLEPTGKKPIKNNLPTPPYAQGIAV